MILTVSRAGIARSGATRSGWPVLSGTKVPCWALSGPSASPYRDVVLRDGASAYWRLDETSGTTAKSLIGNYPGTISGGVTRNQPGGVVGNPAMQFNGTTGKILTAANVTIPVVATVEAWMKILGGTTQAAFSTRQTGQIGVPIFFGTDGSHALVYSSELGFVFGTRIISGQQWHHVVCVLTATGATLYVDGVSDTTVTATRSTASGGPVGIGYEIIGPTFFNGSIDEVAIYPIPLTAAQVAAHYAARTATVPTTTRYTARSGATRSNYTSHTTFISVGGIQVGTIRPGAGVGVLIESLIISDSLSSIPTTGTMTARGWVPVEGADVVITLGSRNNATREFGGTILKTNHRYVGDRPVAANMLYDCALIDYSWGL
jgi:hypothetical protein